jgi:NTE family protein
LTQTVNLALQGGGAHGAFTWGALDRLLEADDIEIEAITATSAGAMNAAALKHGWARGGRAGARASLDTFWLRLGGLDGPYGEAITDWLRMVSPTPALVARLLALSPGAVAADAVTRVLSPYQFNPANWHPLRGIVEELLDPVTLGSDEGPRLFVNATNVRDGKARIFHGDAITADAILASACLPTLFQAIEIHDPRTGRREAYWDGGYTGNPALYPLHEHTQASDIVIVHINPLYREELPTTAAEIMSRINEISFNDALLDELRSIAFVNRLIDAGTIAAGVMKRTNVHSVSDDALMNQLGMVTKTTISRTLLLQLRDAGRGAMERFLTEERQSIGKRSSANLRAMLDASRAGA